MQTEMIFSYSREQALEDGVLVDVTKTAKEAGFRFPVVLTATLWEKIENIPSRWNDEDVNGRLWDVLWMASRKAKANSGSRLTFQVIFHTVNDRRRKMQIETLTMDIGPGDNGEPVITIGYSEDF